MPSARFLHGSSNDQPQPCGGPAPGCHGSAAYPRSPARGPPSGEFTAHLVSAGSVGWQLSSGKQVGCERNSHLQPNCSNAVPSTEGTAAFLLSLLEAEPQHSSAQPES